MVFNDQKLVSIGLPTFNSARVIRRALDSLLGQSYANIELVISDDASVDETGEICKAYAVKDRRVRYIRQRQNIGQLENFPLVLKEARGEYFMWASDDDWWDKSFIELLVEALNRHEGCMVAMGSYQRVYEDGRTLDILYVGDQSTNNLSYYGMFKKMMLFSPHHMFFYGVFRRSFISQVFERRRPECIGWDRVVMAEVALAGRMYSVDQMLFFKSRNSIPVSKRYKDKLSNSYLRPFAYSKLILALLIRPLTSPLIPIGRKLYVFPVGVALVWGKRKRIFWDWVRAYRILRRSS